MTASKLRLASIGLLSVLATSGARSAAVDRTIRVDCDHGGDLQAALKRAGSGPARIYVIGTCVGQFETAGDKIEIIGRSPAESRIGTIVSGPSSFLHVTGPGLLTVRNLAMFDSAYGLYVEGPGRFVIVEGCELTNNGYGVFAQQGALVALRNTQVLDSQNSGLAASRGSELTVIGGSIRDNYRGVSIFDRSTLALVDSEVRGNQASGLLAQSLCTIDATRTTFVDNGVHTAVFDRSALTVADSTLGPPSDHVGPYAYYTGGDSRTTIVVASSPGIVYGAAYVAGGSNLFVQGGTLHDGVRLEDFSWAKLTDAAVQGTISCQTGSDAICAESASAIVSGCGPVSSSCTGTPVPASDPPAFLKFVPEGGIDTPRR